MLKLVRGWDVARVTERIGKALAAAAVRSALANSSPALVQPLLEPGSICRCLVPV
jgi:hypothetical protein